MSECPFPRPPARPRTHTTHRECAAALADERPSRVGRRPVQVRVGWHAYRQLHRVRQRLHAGVVAVNRAHHHGRVLLREEAVEVRRAQLLAARALRLGRRDILVAGAEVQVAPGCHERRERLEKWAHVRWAEEAVVRAGIVIVTAGGVELAQQWLAPPGSGELGRENAVQRCAKRPEVADQRRRAGRVGGAGEQGLAEGHASAEEDTTLSKQTSLKFEIIRSSVFW